MLLVIGLLTAGCGSANDVGGGTGGPRPAGSTVATPGTQPLEIHRTGGIAGFDDRLVIVANGTAALTTRGGRRQSCRLPAPLVDRVRGIRWDALPTATPPSGRSDVLLYVVTEGGRSTTLDGDVPPAGQAAAVDTVAELFAALSACPPAP